MPSSVKGQEIDHSPDEVEPGTSNSLVLHIAGSEEDEGFSTPRKESAQRGHNPPRRRSPRGHTGSIQSPDTVRGKYESPGSRSTAPNSPKTPLSKITSTPKIPAGSDFLDSPNLEPFNSNDSFVVPSSIVQASPRKTPLKKGTQLGTPSKNTPSKAIDSLNSSGPSPYKPQRPKYLPKNINLYHKKQKERQEFLQKVEKFDAQLMRLPSLIASPKRVKNRTAANEGDILGTRPHLAVIFHPENFFVNYDENTFGATFDLNVPELVRRMTTTPHIATEEDFKMLCLFLTVTSDEILCNAMSIFVEENFEHFNYALRWADLKSIVINLGLSKEFYIFENASYCGIEPRLTPKMCNFEFLFKILEYSFPHWSKDRWKRLLKFLSDCLFDPLLQKCQHSVIVLLRRVAQHALQEGVAVEELVTPLNHSHYSMSANRMIIQYLAVDPPLKPLTSNLAYLSIHTILNNESDKNYSLSHVADMLDDIQRVRDNTGVKDIYQLIVICESLVFMSARPFDPEKNTFLEKLADFADRISPSYNNFENLYFMDTVTRLRTICASTNF